MSIFQGGERKVDKRRRRTFAALIFGGAIDDLPFTSLDGPYYPEVTVGNLLILTDTETGKRFHIKNDGLFVIEDDTTIGRYLAFLPNVTVGVFNSGRFVLAAVETGPFYPEVVSGLMRLNSTSNVNRFVVSGGTFHVDSSAGTLLAYLPESGSKADQEMRFVLK